MASVISLQIKIDSGPSVAELDRIAAGMSGVTEKTLELDRAANNMTGSVSRGTKNASDGVDKMHGHMATGLDSVRLLSQEFGLRLPRAIESMLSRMPGVVDALSKFLGVMATIAAIQVFTNLAMEAHRLYEEYISLNAIQKKYLEGLDKARQADLGNSHDIETTKTRLALETQIASQMEAQATAMAKFSIRESPLGYVVNQFRAHGLEEQATQAKEARNILARKKVDDDNTAAIADINLRHAGDSTLGEGARIEAERLKKRQLDAQERINVVAQDRAFGAVTDPHAGESEQRAKDAEADAEAAAARTLLYRKERDERITAQNAAINSGLEGEARYRAELEQSIDAITRKFHDGEISKQTFLSETASAQLKADNEALLRLQKLQDEARQMHRQTTLEGLDPGARIGQEERNAVADINTKEANFSGGQPLSADARAAFASERADAHAAAVQKMTALEDSFGEHVKGLEDARLESSLSAFDKINAGAQKEINDLQRLYDKDFKDATLTDQQKEAAAKDMQAGITAITGAADQQRLELSQRNYVEDLQYAQQAADSERRIRANGITGWINSYKDGIAAIQAQEQQRLAKLQEDITKEGLTRQEAGQRQQDIVREANANIAEQNQQMQDKIAGDLQAAFTNPVDFIKQQMEKMFFEILAGWIMKMNLFKTLFGQTMGSLQPTGVGQQSGPGGIFGSITQAIPGTRGIVNGTPNVSSIYTNAAGTSSAGGGGFGASSGTASPSTGVLSSAHSSNASISAIMGDARSATSTLRQIPGFGGSSSSLSIPGTRGIVNGTAPVPGGSGDDPYTAGISDADAQAAINSGTIGPQSGGGFQQGLGTAALVGGAAYSAEQTTVKAFETGSPLQGALGDAAAGAAIGSVVPGVGTAIGALLGAAVGASSGLLGMVTGEAGNLGARDYYEKSVLPSLESMSNQSGDYQTAVSDVGKTASDAMAYMTVHFGRSAANWVNDNYMTKETQIVLQHIEDSAAGGRQYTAMSAAQFHTGGTITGFGDLSTSSNEGFIHAMLNETVMNPAASMMHAPALSAMQGGASHSDIAAMYLAGMKPSSAPSQSGGDTHHHWDVQTMDSKSFDRFLADGAARQINKRLNTFTSQYAGDGISG